MTALVIALTLLCTSFGDMALGRKQIAAKGRQLVQESQSLGTLAEPGASDSPDDGCSQRLDPRSIQLPGCCTLQWSGQVSGTRNYTCLQSGRVGASLAVAHFTGPFEGRLYFTSPSVAPTDFTDPFTGQRLGTVTIDTSRPGNVIVDTASPPGQLPAARIRATSRGSLPRVNWVVRGNISGGGAPAECPCSRNLYYLVPYSATHWYYYCP